MESNSAMNRINCSQAAAENLRKQCPDLPLRNRGLVTIKGKGRMECFWVNEESRGTGNDALERIQAKRKVKMLESSIDNWSRIRKTGDLEAGSTGDMPEQYPKSATQTTLSTLTEASREFSVADASSELSMESVAALDAVAEPSAEMSTNALDDGKEFDIMRENLKSRLERLSPAKQVQPDASYFV